MKRKQTAAAAAAVLLALSSPLPALAGPSGADGGAGEAYLAELNDGTLQYSELPGLVERYNVTYKNTYAQIAGQSQSLEAARFMLSSLAVSTSGSGAISGSLSAFQPQVIRRFCFRLLTAESI